MMLKMERARLESKTEEVPIVQSNTVKRLGENDAKFDQEKLADALREERKRKAGNEDESFRGDKRRKYNGGADIDVTEEELGAFWSCHPDSS
jgi:pre-mRNA-processing factor SLU7